MESLPPSHRFAAELDAGWGGTEGGEAERLRGNNSAVLRRVENQMGGVETFLQEMLRRRDVLNGTSRKRKPSLSTGEPVLSLVASSKLRDYLITQMSDSSDSSEADSPPGSITSLDSQTSISSPTFPSENSMPILPEKSVLDLIPECVPHFSQKVLDEITMPMSGWNPSTMTLPPPRPANLESPTNRELLQAYLDISAKRLADTSPSYVDLFRKYIPAMAYDSTGLMEGILALAAIQIGLMRKDTRIVAVDAASHYHKALKAHFNAVADPNSRSKDSLLATSIILGHYEIWNGENVKMGVHMLGGRDIILARGKAAHMTPVGRALYAAFNRMDVATSSITGNPTFLTKDWWTVDPFTRVPISTDSPTLLAADAALSKLCVLCCKLTYLKAWSLKRRRTLWVKSNGNPSLEQKESLQEIIEDRVLKLEEELDMWYAELPSWFSALDTGPPDYNPGDEDINTTPIASIAMGSYQHTSIALVHGWAIGVRLQLNRISNPDMPVVPPRLGSLCHTLLRIFACLPSSTDACIVAPLFAAGMELRQKCHQEWLLIALRDRIDETGFHGLIFLREGLRFTWAKLEGMNKGRFNRIKEGAASKIDGVSENLWAAEGMLGTFEKLALYDSPDMVGKRKNFQGDIDTSNLPEDLVPYEAPKADPIVIVIDSASSSPVAAPKRLRSDSPEIILVKRNGRVV
ncbi:unnamed protein product [Tuber aestivum]|uniref:Transcription factor domain-containing protein n=1 Tax=Tuber aestivum TaxID=59557 RepID=A0A292PNQ8_9PEZI|nr:unnamed protein product [Tuber aestivum]